MARNMSIEDVSRATKITQTLIRAIESDDFAKLPGGLFTRGYLRAYAREVGLNPEELIERYRGGFDVAAPKVETAPAKPRPDPARNARSRAPVAGVTSRSRHVQILRVCLLLCMAALSFALSRRPEPATPTEATTVAPVTQEGAAPKQETTPVATKGTAAPEPPQTLTLDVRPKGSCWVQVTTQGQRVLGRLMDAGEHESITVKDDVT